MKCIVRHQWSERELVFAELESTSQDVGSNLESVMCIRRLQYSGQFCIASTHMNMLKQVGGWLCAAPMIIRTYGSLKTLLTDNIMLSFDTNDDGRYGMLPTLGLLRQV